MEAAEHFLRVALGHPECRQGEVISNSEVQLDLKVEMPLQMKVDGVSDTGVRIVEPVTFIILPDYPWLSPRVEFRPDFPRNFPHLLPGPLDRSPRPCLVDGDQDEFFLQFGLVDYGIFHLIEQVAIWLRKAAINHLIDPAQGWEPMMRRGMADLLAFDADAARACINKVGGFASWRARFGRTGQMDAQLNAGASTYIFSDGAPTPLSSSDADLFAYQGNGAGLSRGNTVVGIIWPDKPAKGGELVCSDYLPEDVGTLRALRERADAFGCRRGLDLFIKNVERCWSGYHLGAPFPLGVILCVRRPFPLIGSSSHIELLPYAIEIRPFKDRKTLFAQGEDEPVAPAMHSQSITPSLLRSISGTGERPAIAMLGCGSVGSKLAMHAARSGQMVLAVSDYGWLRPHNMARHALSAASVGGDKADTLASELGEFGPAPAVYKGNLAAGLRDEAIRPKIVPKGSSLVINSTASLSVREAMAATSDHRSKARNFEVALFGLGRVGYLLADGQNHNPNHCDLMAELYATIDEPETVKLLFDPAEGLNEIQIGQGCGSLTMPMEDAQLSMMTAALAMQVNRTAETAQTDGIIVIGTSDSDTTSTRWRRTAVPPFETVPIDGSGGWELRISKRVADRIRQEAECFKSVETGGLMIGLSSERLKTVTVVDLLDAPADSQRSASLFTLGVEGLQSSIERRHLESGKTLFDVGTWHSHLVDEGPSSTDWDTAAVLAAERTPPSVLLIVTPKRFHALIGNEKANG